MRVRLWSLCVLFWSAILLLVPGWALAAGGDGEVQAEIQQTLDVFDEFQGVQVEVKSGVAILKGQVGEQALTERAARLAGSIDGVRTVDNQLEVSRGLDARLWPVLERMEESVYDFVAALPLLVVALLVLALTWTLAGWAGRRKNLYGKLSHNPFMQDILGRVVWIAVMIAGSLIALEILDATALVGGILGAAGVVGLAVGFAFRELIENYIASVMLSLRRPFDPDDAVMIGSHAGVVTRLTTRATLLTTYDGNLLQIPNAQVFKSVILNYSRTPDRRFDFFIEVGKGEDLAQVQELALDALQQVEGVLQEPAAFALVHEVGSFGVSVKFHGWVDQRAHSFSQTRSHAIARVKEALQEAGVALPEHLQGVQARVEPAQEALGRASGRDHRPRPSRSPVQRAHPEQVAQRRAHADRSQQDQGEDLLNKPHEAA